MIKSSSLPAIKTLNNESFSKVYPYEMYKRPKNDSKDKLRTIVENELYLNNAKNVISIID